MANPCPTPKPENLRPPWPTGTSGNPAGYSRGRRISDAIERLIEEMVRLADSAILEVAIRWSSAFNWLTDALKAKSNARPLTCGSEQVVGGSPRLSPGNARH